MEDEMVEFEIYFKDLTPEAQQRMIEKFKSTYEFESQVNNPIAITFRDMCTE